MAFGVIIGNDNKNDTRDISILEQNSHGKDLYTTDNLARSTHKRLMTAIRRDDVATLYNNLGLRVYMIGWLEKSPVKDLDVRIKKSLKICRWQGSVTTKCSSFLWKSQTNS